MTLKQKFLPLTVTFVITLTCSSSGVLLANDLLTLEVISPLPVTTHSYSYSASTLQAAPTSDAAQALLNINGISGSRMGGRGMDPVIRGMSQTQLNIILDGAYLHGGCPNRMDPPTTYVALDTYDNLQVIKGNRSVIYGGGGSGGTLLFERQRPVFEDGKYYRGRVGAGYTDNGDTEKLDLDLAAGNESGYLRLLAETIDAGNYHDGSGNQIRSSYDDQTQGLLAGVRLADTTWLEASYEQKRENDVLFPGAGMDSPYSDADTWRLKLEHFTDLALAERVRVEVYRTEVSHLMDNYSLRDIANPMMRMKAPTASDTTGARLLIDSHIRGMDLTWGMDWQRNEKTGERLQLTAMGDQVRGILWPDVDLQQTGLFVQAKQFVNATNRLDAGLRYDRVSASAGRAGESFSAMGSAFTPEQLYGQPAGKQREDNLAGFIGWTHYLNDQYRVETHLSRSVRTADATERFIAAPNWVGTPDLQPEKHYQFEMLLGREADTLSWSLSAFYNQVDDYILRETSTGASRYRNIDAQLYGAEMELAWQINNHWQFTQGLAYTRGENRDDQQDLSQISPLTGSLGLNYRHDRFEGGLWLQAAARQNNVCLQDSACGGQDVEKTPSYQRVDLHAAYDLTPSITLAAGVNNLLDTTYALHQSRASAADPRMVQVNEPGRAFWIKGRVEF